MSNTIRIRTTPNSGDKYLKVKLDQDFDFVEILSLKISQEEVYRNFCSDYGVIVGRVIINSGFGVPNAKVSVFIPVEDIDKDDPVINGLYPFEVITDKDSNGIRYNLFPKTNVTDNDCYTPIGTLSTKREVLDNDASLYVYCKYYKFTTTTNNAGDFMFFGVPNGVYKVHVDVDISDIGIASQRPYDLISQGTPEKMFENPNKFKGGSNLDRLIQVKSANAGVNVQPFWGDKDNCEIGITRIDFDLNYNIRPAAIFMGSIYGDQKKHSINKRCRPRKKLGLMCEQVTGAGTINMIRKTLDGGIERYDIEGGRLIDDDGTWAYQIPMNLDYVVTDEFGNLIPSDNPNKGIPTRARVRFNIGIDEDGSAGRLRTRARYLVPNNPQSTSDVDYSFDETTKNSNFRDLHWNKIYTVSNFISRFQKNSTGVSSRSITGLKSVDECAGDKTPFPFNKVDTDLSPIFFIICLIIKIIGFIVYLINAFFIPIINALIKAINDFMNGLVNFICGTIIGSINDALSWLGFSTIGCGLSWNDIEYVPCITIRCAGDDGDLYAPGCKNSDKGFAAAEAKNGTITYYPGDSFGHPSSGFDLAGLDDCFAFELAKALNIFHFDFYNDWVNGSLFAFLLKYKKKKNKSERFCEYDCKDFGGGVDGNNNNKPDNNCHNNLLLDTCYPIGGDHSTSSFPRDLKNSQNKSKDSGVIRDGLIKKVSDEFFYASATHDLNYKLFATDLVCLGAVFNCDWQGIPKIQPLIIPTTYKVPPDQQEVSDDGTSVETCGMCGLGGSTQGLFFEINCAGVHVDDRQCLNIRHICEMGVDIDQAPLEDEVTGAVIVPADCRIGVTDIDDAGGRFFRDVFTGLNSGTTIPSPLVINNYTTDFNLNDNPTYDFATTSENGSDYIAFRGWTPSSSSNYLSQTKHSYYFYYGILPGKTAVEKMNQRFFNRCFSRPNQEFLIQATAIPAASGSTGSISFNIINGVGPFTYVLNGGTPVTITSLPVTLSNLPAGSYTISVTDSNGLTTTTTVIIVGPPSLYGSAFKLQDSSGSTAYSGIIQITSVGGGVSPYTCKLEDHNGNVISPTAYFTVPKSFTNLAPDSGYKVTICDSASPVSCITINNIAVYGPNVLTLSASSTSLKCNNSNDGTLILTSSGGILPKSYSTTGPAGFSSTAINMSNLKAGNYSSTVTDSSIPPNQVNIIKTITEPPSLTLFTTTPELKKQCDPNFYNIPFYASSVISAFHNGESPLVAGPINVEYSLDNGGWTTTAMTYVNSTTPLILTIPKPFLNNNIRVRYSKNYTGGTCYSNSLVSSNGVLRQTIELPTVPLTLYNNSTTNQCTPNFANISLNILVDPARLPLNMEYSFNGGSSWSTMINANGSSYSTTVPVPSNKTWPTNTGNVNMLVRATDNVGCQYTVNINNFKVPSQALSASVSTSGPDANFFYTHTVTPSGGIPPYTGGGVFINISPNYYPSITDSNGCTYP